MSDHKNGGTHTPPHATENDFDRNEGWINTLFNLVFIICGVVSAYATFSGIRLFLDETGDVGLFVNGTAVILTVAVCAILTIGWSVMCRWGPSARTPLLKGGMVGLGAVLFAITLSVSSLSNLMALVGPAAKQHSWRLAHAEYSRTVNVLESRALGVVALRPAWLAEQNRACQLGNDEIRNGTVSASGRGVGPVAVALSGACAQTTSFVEAMDAALATTEDAALAARGALRLMRTAIRDRKASIIDREDRFLDAGDLLNAAMQKVRAADLSQALDSGARQVAASIVELGENSAFTPKQVEMVSAIKEGLEGLIVSTAEISGRLRADPLPVSEPVRSPDFIEAILTHAHRFIPVFAAAIGIDAFMLWALGFLLISKSGRGPGVPGIRQSAPAPGARAFASLRSKLAAQLSTLNLGRK